jgi:hypothetical protein
MNKVARYAILSLAVLAQVAASAPQTLAQSKTTTASNTRAGQQFVGLRNFEMVAERPTEYRKFRPISLAQVEPGQPVLIYAEPVNFGWSRNGSKYKFHTLVDLELTDTAGRQVASAPGAITLLRETDQMLTDTFVTLSVPVTAAPGRYTLSVRFRDVNNENRSVTKNFPIQMGGQPNGPQAQPSQPGPQPQPQQPRIPGWGVGS